MQRLYDFWFGAGDLNDPIYIKSRMKLWFGKDEAIDLRMRLDFAPGLDQPIPTSELVSAVLLCDQVPRNAFRDTPRSFAYDAQARELSALARQQRLHTTLPVYAALFILLPLEHSEDLKDQQLNVELCEQLKARAPAVLKASIQGPLDFAKRHKAVIERFGRFPHRNKILKRESTALEIEFLKQPGSRF